MSKIINYKKEIMESNPNHQIIEMSLHPTKWENLNNDDVNETLNSLHVQQGRYVITRNDVRNTKGKQRIVIALMWAFSDNPRVQNIRRVLDNLDSLKNMLGTNEGKDLSEQEFVKLYNKVSRTPGVGGTTASILLFFYNIKCNGDACIAITGHITPEFVKFDELSGYERRKYIEQIKQFNNIARKLNVTAEQVEYFLYRVNRGEITIN